MIGVVVRRWRETAARRSFCFSTVDTQVQTVMTAAADLSQEKLDLFLKRIEVARPLMHREHFTDAELKATINVALRGLLDDVAVPPADVPPTVTTG